MVAEDLHGGLSVGIKRRFEAELFDPNLLEEGHDSADEVAEGLGLEARPPHPGGYSLKETDWALLDPVKQMDPLYRKADGPGDES